MKFLFLMYFQITEKLFTTPFKKRLDAKKASRVNLMRVLLETERLQYALRNVPVLKNHHGPWSRWMCRILRRANRAKAAPALTNALYKSNVSRCSHCPFDGTHFIFLFVFLASPVTGGRDCDLLLRHSA